MSSTLSSRTAFNHQQGFTIIELLLVIMLVGILGTVALSEFLDFRREARIAAAIQLAQAVATGIKLQHKQAILRCKNSSQTQLPLESIEQNDITAGAGALCTTAQLPDEADRKFFDGPTGPGSFPINPMTGLRTIGVLEPLDTGESYASTGTCSAESEGTTYGWCYNPTTGDLVASNDPAPDANSGAESSEESSESSESSAPAWCSLVGGTWNEVLSECNGQDNPNSYCSSTIGNSYTYTEGVGCTLACDPEATIPYWCKAGVFWWDCRNSMCEGYGDPERYCTVQLMGVWNSGSCTVPVNSELSF